MDRSQRDDQRQAELETARTEAQERAYHRGWQGLLDANGMSPGEEGFVDVARSLRLRSRQALSRLADEYGGQAVRESDPEVVQGMVAARRYGGIPLTAQAQAARVEGLDGEGRYALRSAYDADELRGCTHGMLLKVCRLKSSVCVEYNRADSTL